eukprot:CAMPEP_0202870328 /NCGR_PEP_ID=MMETSP1391-20130828/15367_1 /ASSEMBLY_ACC=CAM_ASM_000867 /TAXON_ID=1034604 /ORGANISM="Chlamydomonas leiostraca, Strain SAG 11-49" /LENGTH=109 /DNA_ID=CAMNT_0049550861 /DNA_START=90 /DNA_END=419 /DNA_ORIENTATION=+
MSTSSDSMSLPRASSVDSADSTGASLPMEGCKAGSQFHAIAAGMPSLTVKCIITKAQRCNKAYIGGMSHLRELERELMSPTRKIRFSAKALEQLLGAAAARTSAAAAMS